ncbi:hypothetical protein, partial [Hymenobacter coccineus]|uniref:hypothetical protein n=1 Tax=Hymenobacter coccineus TaxID=1908235 RepID=UPI001955BDC4
MANAAVFAACTALVPSWPVTACAVRCSVAVGAAADRVARREKLFLVVANAAVFAACTALVPSWPV